MATSLRNTAYTIQTFKGMAMKVTFKSEVPGPPLFNFFKESSKYPAIHFYELMNRYGDIVKCGPFFYLISHPDMAREILNRDQKDFSQEDFIGRRVKSVFGLGMVTSKGDIWSSQRRLLNPVFSYNQLHQKINLAAETIESIIEQWDVDNKSNEPLDLVDLMETLAIIVGGQILFNSDFSKYLGDIKEIVRFGTAYIAESLPFFMPLWIPTYNNLKLKQVNRRIDEIMEQIVSELDMNMADKYNMAYVLNSNLGGHNQNSLKKRLMIDEMKTMLGGLHFPICSSLSMYWHTLSRNIRYYDWIKEEIHNIPKNYVFNTRFYDDFPRTTATIFEAMRLNPIAFSIWRKAKVDFNTQGITIPKGKSVCISLYNIHRHPEFWNEPDRFDPTRFLPERAKTHKRTSIAFCSFIIIFGSLVYCFVDQYPA